MMDHRNRNDKVLRQLRWGLDEVLVVRLMWEYRDSRKH